MEWGWPFSLTPALSMNLPQIQGDRRWDFPSVVALNLRETFGGSWFQCTGFDPWRLSMNLCRRLPAAVRGQL
jgi:hypothetical protein